MKTQIRCKWSDEDLEVLSKVYTQYPYQIPQWLLDKHGVNGCYTKASKLGIAKGIRHPGLDLSLLSESDKGYIAGFLDGEGSIIFYKDRVKPNPAIQLPNTHKGVVEWLQKKLTCGTLAITVREKSNPNWKTLYQLHIHGAKQVYDILIAIEPYLLIKRDKAIEAIKCLREKYNFS